MQAQASLYCFQAIHKLSGKTWLHHRLRHLSFPVQLVIEGNVPNLDVTAPGGILGLALMYLQTNDRSIAALFEIPSTAFALDFVRPDFILLRMLGRSLVMWDGIQPTAAWIEAQLPPFIKVGSRTLLTALRLPVRELMLSG